VIILQAGLDGSYRWQEPSIFAYAGVAAYEEDWKAAALKWQTILNLYGINRFRMREAMRFEGDFRQKKIEWGDDREAKREGMLNQLADVVIGAKLQPVGCAADTSLLSPGTRAAMVRDVLERVIRQLLEVIPAVAQLGLVCDREEDLAKEVMKWLNKLQLSEPTIYGRIAGVCYMNSHSVVILQAADMLAYLFREYAEQKERDPSIPINPLLDKMTRSQMVYRRI